MKTWLSIPPLLAACSAPSVLLDGPSPRDDSGTHETHDSGETGPPPVETGDTSTEWIPGTSAYEQSDHLFQLDLVHAVEITLSQASWDSLTAEPFTYVVADVTIDGEPVSDVGVRVKGRLGSYRELYEKAAFKIDFNRFVPDQTFHALEKLNVNNMVQDSAQVHERLAYAVYRMAGVPVPRVGYAWVRVNGTDFGLYSLGEPYDDVFLEGRYEDPSGNLYDGDYVWYGGSSYQKLDFSEALVDLFELDEGEDVGHADIRAISDAVAGAMGGQGFDETLGTLVDMDELIAMWTGDVWTGHYDSYSFNQNNFRVYFDPQDGLADLFAWDPDWAFYSSTPITTPSGLLSRGCKVDSGCHERFDAALDALCAAVAASDLEEQLDQARQLIGPYIEADPRKETSTTSARASQEEVRRWIRGRCDALASTGGL
jgi:hypothetical protein